MRQLGRGCVVVETRFSMDSPTSPLACRYVQMFSLRYGTRGANHLMLANTSKAFAERSTRQSRMAPQIASAGTILLRTPLHDALVRVVGDPGNSLPLLTAPTNHQAMCMTASRMQLVTCRNFLLKRQMT